MTLWERKGMFLTGSFGGILPTLAALAPMYISDWTTPLPTIGFFFGLSIWAVVGGVVAMTNSTPDVRQAIFAGVAAPAIIANLNAGASEANMRRKTSELFPHQIAVALSLAGSGLFSTSAIAQSTGAAQVGNSNAVLADKSGTIAVFHPNVVGPGAPNTFAVKVIAQISKDGKITEVPIGEITNLSSDSALAIPVGAKSLVIDGQTFPIDYPITQVAIDVKTRASKTNDFFWALGVPRDFKVQDFRVSKAKS